MPRFGVGFRRQHFADLVESRAGVDWLELLSDNYLAPSRARAAELERLRAELPLALHGVSLNVASDTGPRGDYLARLRALADRIEPVFVSDHLCWTGLGGVESHDLLPIALTREVLALVSERVERIQDTLGRRLLLENATAYVAFRADELGEAEFFRALCTRTGCGILLDVNNLFVNAQNLGTDPTRYLDALAPDHVGYLHLAGHSELPGLRIDTHGAAVPDPVWRLFHEVARRFPAAPVILERDDAIPPLAELVGELEQARALWRGAVWTGRQAPLRRGAPELAATAGGSRGAAPRWDGLRNALWRHIVGPVHGGDAGSLLATDLPVDAARGLRVYGDAYGENARRALTSHFPAVARVLGDDEFAALACAYLSAHPSRSHDYVAFGAQLPEFLRAYTFPSNTGVAKEAFAELAALEQAQLEVQETEGDEHSLSPRELLALSAADWEAARFRFVVAQGVLIGSHDVLPAVRAVARGEAPSLPEPRACAYLVTRRGEVPYTDALDPRGAGILGALAAGATFAEACRNAGGGEPDVEVGVAALALACARGALREICVTRRGGAGIEGASPGGSPRCPSSPIASTAAAS